MEKIKNNNSAYNISLEIINLTEKEIFRGKSKSKASSLFPNFTPEQLDTFPLLLQKSIIFLKQLIFQFHQLIIKPILIIYFGVKQTLILYYIKFIIIFIIIILLKRCVIVPFIKVEDSVYLLITSILFALVVLFRKTPSHAKNEIKLIPKLRAKFNMSELEKEQWSFVLNNINLFKDNLDKRIKYMNSFFTFLWAIYLLIFKFFYSSLPQNFHASELIGSIIKPLFYYLLVVVLIRIYSKVYSYVFEMIYLSINEILFLKSIKH